MPQCLKPLCLIDLQVASLCLRMRRKSSLTGDRKKALPRAVPSLLYFILKKCKVLCEKYTFVAMNQNFEEILGILAQFVLD